MHAPLKFTLLSILLMAHVAASHAQDTTPLDEQSRQTANELLKTLGGELKAAMTSGGPAEAISVCKAKAPAIAAAAAQKTGMQIKRVSSKNRNPKAVPDNWENEALAALEKRLAAGEKPETLDMSALIDTPNGKVYRYAKALVTQSVCLNCHGAPEKLIPDVKAKLAVDYPDDKAIGYTPGMIRGIISIKKTL